MVAIIVIGSIVAYCLFSGIAAKILEEFFNMDDDCSIVVGAFWPVTLTFFLGSGLITKIASKKKGLEQSKDAEIIVLKQDLVIAQATRFKIKDENDFEKAEKSCSRWRKKNPLIQPHR